MTKLFGLFFLALVCWAPDVAQAANRFAVCSTTCTWDNTSTAMWSTTSGGATGASAPVAGDAVTLDAATCVGGTTCTITTFSGTITVDSLTMSACTASTSGCILDASANNTNFVIQFSGNAYINTGSGTRTLNMGTGTWTLSGNAAIWQVVASATINASTSTIAFTGTGGTTRRAFVTGGKTYGTVTATSSSSATVIQGGGTIATLTIAPSNLIEFAAGVTTTITNFTDIVGSSSTQTMFVTDTPATGSATISSANNWNCTWCGFAMMTFSGGGAFAATNSASYRGVSGITVTAPSGGGGGGGRIIGG